MQVDGVHELFDENLGFLGSRQTHFYFTITDESQNIIYQSNVLEDNSFPVTFSLDNLPIKSKLHYKCHGRRRWCLY